MKEFPIIAPGGFRGRNIKFGVREFGMGTISNGPLINRHDAALLRHLFDVLRLHRNSIRLAALSPYHVIYQFTHDSIFLGEDGPTQQPVEHFGRAAGDSPFSCDSAC